MGKHFFKIIRLNVVTIFSLLIYSVYLLLRVILVLYKQTSEAIMAVTIIPFITLLVIGLFISSSTTIYKGLYNRQMQKFASILFIVYVAISDVLIIYAFKSFHPFGKVLFILINFIAIVHIRRYLIKKSVH